MYFLYRHWDRYNNLLYVGISLSTVQRLSEHRRAARWYDKIYKITIEQYSSKKEALEAEKVAIKVENPAFNIQHSSINKKHAKEVTINQKACLLLAKNDTLHGTEYKVLLYLTGVMDFKNQVIASQTHIAKELGMKQPQVSEAINKLVTAGAIRKISILGSNGYYIEPVYAIKGSR